MNLTSGGGNDGDGDDDRMKFKNIIYQCKFPPKTKIKKKQQQQLIYTNKLQI